jgi:hypothetical protein
MADEELDKIDYPALLQDALRDVVRRVLEQVSEHGLPGEHHLYIGFRTRYPGVQVPRYLSEQYPEEVTIVLQHQFWALNVTPESFSVFLSFGGSKQQLIVPFGALTAFADPSADFGLRFDGAPEPAGESEAEPAEPEPSEPAEPAPPAGVIRFDPSRRR